MIRLVFLLISMGVGFYLPYTLFEDSLLAGAIGSGVGMVLSIIAILAEYRSNKLSANQLAHSLVGVILAVAVVRLLFIALRQLLDHELAVPPISGSAGALVNEGESIVMPVVNYISPILKMTEAGCLLVFSYIAGMIFYKKADEINLLGGSAVAADTKKKAVSGAPAKILDTSVIIDGRIADIAETKFLDGILLVPRFVLKELQLISDSSDRMKRQRGRRGLDVLKRLQHAENAMVQISETDYPDLREVDHKLIRMAKELGADVKVITNDFNLNKVAQIQNVDVLNINELANAIKPIVLPGEEMVVQVMKIGKDPKQGIAYLDDGTMVVVEGGHKKINKKLTVTVTSVLQTPAGRMIFAK